MTSGGAVKDSDALKTFNRSAPFKSFKRRRDREYDASKKKEAGDFQPLFLGLRLHSELPAAVPVVLINPFHE